MNLAEAHSAAYDVRALYNRNGDEPYEEAPDEAAVLREQLARREDELERTRCNHEALLELLGSEVRPRLSIVIAHAEYILAGPAAQSRAQREGLEIVLRNASDVLAQLTAALR